MCPDGDRLLVVVGDAAQKTWWRNFSTSQTIDVLVRRRTMTSVARLLPAGSKEALDAVAMIRTAQPRLALPDDAVIIELRPEKSLDSAERNS